MGYVTTHVLDTAHGMPASGLAVEVWRETGGDWTKLKDATTNSDGRLDSPAITESELTAGTYEIRFQVAAYFRGLGVNLPEPPFLDVVPIRFGVADAEAHYHVPLLVSPYSYSTYRGS